MEAGQATPEAKGCPISQGSASPPSWVQSQASSPWGEAGVPSAAAQQEALHTRTQNSHCYSIYCHRIDTNLSNELMTDLLCHPGQAT